MESHVPKSDPPEKVDHVLQEAHRCEAHLQPSQQRRDEARDERQVCRWLFPKIGPTVGEFEVLQVLKKPNEVYDLSIGPSGFRQAERSERWQEVFKVPLNLRYEVVDVQILYLEIPDIGQRGKLAEGTVVEKYWGQPNHVVAAPVEP